MLELTELELIFINTFIIFGVTSKKKSYYYFLINDLISKVYKNCHHLTNKQMDGKSEHAEPYSYFRALLMQIKLRFAEMTAK